MSGLEGHFCSISNTLCIYSYWYTFTHIFSFTSFCRQLRKLTPAQRQRVIDNHCGMCRGSATSPQIKTSCITCLRRYAPAVEIQDSSEQMSYEVAAQLIKETVQNARDDIDVILMKLLQEK